MKQFIVILCIISFLFTSCSNIDKSMKMDETDMKYVFLPADINGFSEQDYSNKPLKNGSDYYFNKTNDKNNGLYFTYSVTMLESNNEEIKVKTILSILKNDRKAIELFESSIKTLNLFYKSDVVNILPKEFNADQAFLVNTNDFFSLVLQSDNIFYEVDIEGINLEISNVKDNIIKKLNAVMENY